MKTLVGSKRKDKAGPWRESEGIEFLQRNRLYKFTRRGVVVVPLREFPRPTGRAAPLHRRQRAGLYRYRDGFHERYTVTEITVVYIIAVTTEPRTLRDVTAAAFVVAV